MSQGKTPWSGKGSSSRRTPPRRTPSNRTPSRGRGQADIIPAGGEIGPYVVEHVLGKGGMGVVYAARRAADVAAAAKAGDGAASDAPWVALKTVRSSEASILLQLRREIHILSRLEHPGVVRLVDHGVSAGRPWYAMELIAGFTLRDGLERLGAAGATTVATVSGKGSGAAEESVKDGALAAVFDVPTSAPPADETAAPPPALETEVGLTELPAQNAATGQLEDGGGVAPTGSPVSPADAATAQSMTLGGDVGTAPGSGAAATAMTRAMRAAYTSMSQVHVGEHVKVPPKDPAPPDAELVSEHRRGKGPTRAAGGHLPRAMGLLRSICDALAFIHGRGVIHRDLKPDNIFVRRGGQIVLVDFGIAARIGSTTGREVLGLDGQVSGTVYYMAPEQLRGELLDARSDLYSLGCIFYEALTGRPPFVGKPEVVARKHLDAIATPPSLLVSGVPPEVDSLVASLLAKEQSQRLGYAADLGDALDRLGATPVGWGGGLPEPQPYLYRAPFVGREQLFSQLKGALSGLASGRGGVLLVGGESGVGKTRLVLEGAVVARRKGMAVVTGECRRGDGGGAVQGAPLHPLSTLLEAVVDRYLSRTNGETDDELERFVRHHAPVLADYCPAIAALEGVAEQPAPPALPAAAAKLRLFRALTATFADYTRAQPLLLILDDMQWADELTLEFIEHVSLLSGVRPVLLVGTYRSEEAGERLTTLGESPATKTLSVNRMEPGEVRQMVSGMLAHRDPPEAFVAFLARQSQGNPFFVAEYLRTAIAEQVLVRVAHGRWTIAESESPTEELCENLPLPRSLREIVQLRLDRLTGETRRVLDTAAVIGRRIDVEVLRKVEGLDDATLVALLDEMLRLAVIEAADDGGYRFVHDKLREVPEAELDAARREDLHRRVAQAMEQVYGLERDAAAERGRALSRSTKHAEIGRHWSAGAEPAKAVPYLVEAGDRARDCHAVGEAIALYRQALDDVARASAASADGDWWVLARCLDEKLGDTLTFAGHHLEAIEAFQRGMDALDREQLLERVRLRRKIAKVWETHHDLDRSLAAYEAAEASCKGDPAALAPELGREWVRILLGRAYVYYWQGKPDAARQVIDRVAPHVETLGEPIDRYGYYHQLVNWQFREHRYRVSSQTLLHCRLALQAAQGAGAQPEMAFARFMLGFALLFKGDLVEAEAALYTALEASRRIGDAVGETRAASYLALTLRRARRADDARRAANDALALAKARQMRDYIGLAYGVQAWVAYEAGYLGEAEKLGAAARESWDGLPFPHPFRWNGELVCLALTVEGLQRDGELEALESARVLTQATQLQLPDPIDAPLVAAVELSERTGARADGGAGPRREILELLQQALVAAKKLEYL